MLCTINIGGQRWGWYLFGLYASMTPGQTSPIHLGLQQWPTCLNYPSVHLQGESWIQLNAECRCVSWLRVLLNVKLKYTHFRTWSDSRDFCLLYYQNWAKRTNLGQTATFCGRAPLIRGLRGLAFSPTHLALFAEKTRLLEVCPELTIYCYICYNQSLL